MYTELLDINTSGTASAFTSTGGNIVVGDGVAGADLTVAGVVNLADTTVTLDAGENMVIDGNSSAVSLTGASSVNTGIEVATGVTGTSVSAGNTSNTGTIAIDNSTVGLTLTDTAATGAVTLGTGSVLNVNAATTANLGAVDGAAASQGTLEFNTTDYALKNAVGANNALAAVEVTGATTLTAGANITADAINFAGDGIIDVANSTLTGAVTTDTTNEGTLNFTGTGSVVGNIGTGTHLLKEVNYSGTSTLSTVLHATNTNVTAGTTTQGADSAVEGILTVSGGTLDLGTHDLALTGAGTVDTGATLNTTITSASDYGNIVASGLVTVHADAAVGINVADNAELSDGASFTIIDGGVGGSVADLNVAPTDNSNLFNFVQTSNADDLIVTSSLVADFDTDTAGTANAALGSAIQADLAAGNFTTELASSLNTLKGLTAAQQAAALSKMNPELNGASIETAFENQRRIYNTIANRSRTTIEKGLWLDTSFTSTDKDTVDGIDGYDADAKSITIGADVKNTAKTNLGVAFTYTDTDIEGQDSLTGNDTDVDSYNVTLYGSQKLDAGVMVDAQATIGQSEYESTRNLSSIGAGVAKGKYDGKTYGLAANVSKEYDVNGFNIRPVAGLAYNYISLDSYEETGSSANLNVQSESFDSLKSKVGVEVELAQFAVNQNWLATPEVSGFWSHEFMDDTYDRTAGLVGGSSNFTSTGAEPESDTLSVGAGVNFVNSAAWNVGVAYDASIASDATAHMAKLSISKKF